MLLFFTLFRLIFTLPPSQGPDPYFNKLVRILTTRCMTQAVYFPSGQLTPPDFYHYGLAAPLYTHFTSPIRRYAGEHQWRLWYCDSVTATGAWSCQVTDHFEKRCPVHFESMTLCLLCAPCW